MFTLTSGHRRDTKGRCIGIRIRPSSHHLTVFSLLFWEYRMLLVMYLSQLPIVPHSHQMAEREKEWREKIKQAKRSRCQKETFCCPYPSVYFRFSLYTHRDIVFLAYTAAWCVYIYISFYQAARPHILLHCIDFRRSEGNIFYIEGRWYETFRWTDYYFRREMRALLSLWNPLAKGWQNT